MFSKIKNFYKEKTGITDIINQNIAIQLELTALHRKSDEIYWGIIFNNAISNSDWLINKSFNPGRWAAGYPMLYLLYRIYNEVKPECILEFGLGESTKLVYQYNKAFPQNRFAVIEQNKEWLEFFSKQVFDIKDNTILLQIEEAIIENEKVNQYKNFLENLEFAKYDMIVIDGPFGSRKYSRHQIVDMVLNDFIADRFIVIMDDYNRLGEKQTIEKLKEALSEKNISFSEGVYSGIKDTYIICSEKYDFLTSL